MHAVRLGYQGLELLQTGRLTLPMPQTALPEEPDRQAVDAFPRRRLPPSLGPAVARRRAPADRRVGAPRQDTRM